MTMKKIQILVLLTTGLAFLSGCSKDEKHPGYEYMPDMYRSPSYETYSENPNFSDGMSARKPVPGTIPVGFRAFPFDGTKEGYDQAGLSWKVDSTLRTEADLAEGQRQYENFCAPCHGAEGNGDGPVVQAGFAPPPSYSKGNSSRGGKMADLSEGKIYHTITYGLNMMGSHASQIQPNDRSRIVMFVQKLQGPKATAQADSVSSSTPKVMKP